MQLQVNYFGVSLDSLPGEIFKYHVDVERSPDLAADSKYGPSGADQKDETMGDEPKQEGKDEKEDKDVEMSDVSAAPKREQRPERPLPRSLVRNVINAALRQYESEFGAFASSTMVCLRCTRLPFCRGMHTPRPSSTLTRTVPVRHPRLHPQPLVKRLAVHSEAPARSS